MAKPEWGRKWTCPRPGCGVRFYDMMRSPAICPECGTEAGSAAGTRPQRSRPAAEDTTPKAKEATGSFVEDAVDLEEVDETLAEDIDLDGDDEADGLST